ncbi:MAG: HAMP domain-containing histidine kinase [Actinomycetota bacterium]|nr:HAMP domain-containing histidine kinase [Actinomycetota bacterium]
MAVVAVSVALVLFGGPLAFAAKTMIFTEERGELERMALLASRQVGPDFLAGDPVELPPVEGDKQVAIYDARLTLRSAPGTGPVAADEVTRSALGGATSDGVVAGDLVVAVPVTAAENVVAVVRVATAQRLVWGWVLLAWSALALCAAAALSVAVLVARRQARLLSAPLEALAAAAERVGEGDLQIRTVPAGGPELVRLAQTQNDMLDRLSDVVTRERRFTADVSHQLRTPLTGLTLGLQNALHSHRVDPRTDLRQALVDATEQVQDVERTIEDILRLARPEVEPLGASGVRTIADLIIDIERRWHGQLAAEGRLLVVRAQDIAPEVAVPLFLTADVLTILIDNATRHGTGRVEVSFRDLSTAVAVDVTDEGTVTLPAADLFLRGRSGGDGSGIGLALGRSIAEAGGGRLTLACADPTRFTLLVPLSAATDGAGEGQP